MKHPKQGFHPNSKTLNEDFVVFCCDFDPVVEFYWGDLSKMHEPFFLKMVDFDTLNLRDTQKVLTVYLKTQISEHMVNMNTKDVPK